MTTRIRAAIVTEVISPYRVPVFNALADDPRIDLEVIFLAETARIREWRVSREGIRFRYNVLPSRALFHSRVWGTAFLTPGISRALRKGRYACVIFGGYHHPSMWLALGVRNTGKILWSESPADPLARKPVRTAIKRWFVSRMDGFIAAGTPQKETLQALGAPADLIWIAPNAVDTPAMSAAVDAHRTQREALRAHHGLKGPTILYVGRLQDFKGVPDLLDAFALVRLNVPDAQLLMVGDGPDRARYEASCRARGLDGVSFTGFVQPSEIAPYYAVADVFAFPTHKDAWGLVLNEAMSAGLPVVVSRGAGAARDMVAEGRNGFSHAPGDVAGMADGLQRILRDRELAASMGKAAREIVQGFTPKRMAVGMAEAIIGVATRGRAP